MGNDDFEKGIRKEQQDLAFELQNISLDVDSDEEDNNKTKHGSPNRKTNKDESNS